MTSLNYDIKDKLKRLNVFEKIIAINIVIYFVGWVLSKTGSSLSGNSLNWLELPSNFSDFIFKPWTIITYGFTHYDFFHILFNLLVLYFVSRVLLNLFSTKLSLNIYFLGIIFGGLSFLCIYNILPESLIQNTGALVGASAGVRALLIFLSAYMPNREVQFFTISIKLWYIGVALVVIDVLGLFGTNQGGYIAHLGGSLLGYLYAVQLQKGNDIGKGFEKIIDYISSLFKSKSPLKTVHKTKRKKTFAGHNEEEFKSFNKQKRIDLILDKISKSGYDSLTSEEKEFLFKIRNE